MMALSELRKKIDAIDDDILTLLQRRCDLALQTAEVKRKRQQVSIYAPEREQAILTRMIANNASALKPLDIESIYRSIISACRNLQYADQHQDGLIISVQGIPGSFSEQAANAYINKKQLAHVMLHYGGGSAGVMQQLDSQQAHIGLMAINNTWGGLVQETIDALTCSEYDVIDTVAIDVEHALLVSGDAPIQAIYSHPQALRQCRQYLAEHYPSVALHDYCDTASAAKALSQGGLPHASAVVASASCAKLYGLSIKAQAINDRVRNETLFFVVAKA